jgi:hypothetical protein
VFSTTDTKSHRLLLSQCCCTPARYAHDSHIDGAGRVPDRCGSCPCPSHPLQGPVSPCRSGGTSMVAPLLYSQRALWALVWFCVLLPVPASPRGALSPPTATPITPKRQRSNELPPLFAQFLAVGRASIRAASRPISASLASQSRTKRHDA